MTEVQRIISPEQVGDDSREETHLRPQSLAEFVGQEQIVESLTIYLKAAKKRSEALDHVLFSGPPGLGKTTLAGIIAQEMGGRLVVTSGPTLEKPSDLASLLTSLEEQDILFIDEIHRLRGVVEEYLYPAMEDFKMDIMLDAGPGSKSVRLDLKPFTLVGATTRSGMLTSPLRDRFGLSFRLDPYTDSQIGTILMRSAHILKTELISEGCDLLVSRCRGTPRIANRILRRCRDVAQVKGSGKITAEIAQRTLTMLGIDNLGLDEMDRKILQLLAVKFGGAPVGLSTLGAALGEETETIEEVYEPYLIQCGFLQRTPRGRTATLNAYQHLGLKEPPHPSRQESLPLDI